MVNVDEPFELDVLSRFPKPVVEEPVLDELSLEDDELEMDPSEVTRAVEEAEEIIRIAQAEAAKIRADAQNEIAIAFRQKTEAEEVLRNAHTKFDHADAQIAEIMSNAQMEAETLKHTAAEQGYLEGVERGKSEVYNAMEAKLEDLAQAVDNVMREKGQLFNMYEDELVKIAAAIARRVVHMELDSAEDSFIYVLTQAAKQFRNTENLIVTIKEGQLSREVLADPEFLRACFAGIENVEIIERADVRAGTVIMDNSESLLDASVDTQIDVLEEEMQRAANG